MCRWTDICSPGTLFLMVDWLVIIIGVVLIAPFLFLFWSLAKHAHEFPIASTAQVFVGSLLVGIWAATGLVFVSSSPSITNETRSSCMRIGACAVVCAQALFSALYGNIGMNRRTKALARATVFVMLSLFGALLAASFGGWEAYGLTGSREYLRPTGSPLLLFMAAMSNVLFAALASCFYVDYKRLAPTLISAEEQRLNRLGLIFIVIGAILPSPFVSMPLVTSDPIKYLFLMRAILVRFFVSIGFLFLALHITKNSLFLMSTKGTMRGLFRRGVVGWLFAEMTDQGPTIIHECESFNKHYGISESETMLFAAASLTAVGMGEDFGDTSYVLPFPNHNELIAVNVSFLHPDPKINDPRLKDNTPCVFSVIVPSMLLSGIGAISDTVSVLTDFKETTPTVSHLATDENVIELAQSMLNTII